MNKGNISIIFLFLIVYLCINVLSVPQKQLPGRFAGKGIVVGLEYVVFNKRGEAGMPLR